MLSMKDLVFKERSAKKLVDQYVVHISFFLKSTIYYMGHNGSPYLQEELYIKYQYLNLFIQLPNTKNY